MTEADRDQRVRLELAVEQSGVPIGSISLTDFEYGNAMVRYWLLSADLGK